MGYDRSNNSCIIDEQAASADILRKGTILIGLSQKPHTKTVHVVIYYANAE